VRRLCDTAGKGKAVPVSEDLWKALTRASEVSAQSEGAFDVTIGPVIRIWRRARRLHELPEPEKVKEAQELVSYKFMRFDPDHRAVELTKAGMRIDLGGIAKGYAAEEALKVLRKEGVRRAVVHAGGDMAIGEPPPGKPGWTLGVAPPDAGAKPSIYLSLKQTSVACSGDTWQFAVIGDKRYSHIVDPKTGIGLTDHSSVTIVAPDGLTADALSTAVSVLGPERGLKLIEATPGVAGYILQAPDGKIHAHASSRWKDVPKVEGEAKRSSDEKTEPARR
jgi:thiamine biosynthesis lipoprotein